MFFENVAIKEVDEITSDLFDLWVKTLVKQKKDGQLSTHIQQEIDLKLTEIYSLTEDDVRLINRSENSDDETNPSIIALSELSKL